MITLTLDDVANQVINSVAQNYTEACVYLQSCLQKLHNQPRLLNKLGLIFHDRVEYDLACRCFHFLLENYPEHYHGFNDLGISLNRLGMNVKAVEQYKHALAIKPDYHPARSNLAYAMNFFGKTGREEIKQAQQDVAHYTFNKSTVYSTRQALLQKDKLTIAYVSNDLCEHAVGRFMLGILKHHDRTKFEVHVFNNRDNNNDDTARYFKSLDLEWHDIHYLNTDEICNRIERNKVDILIDLSGHTSGNRQDVFAHRVAPVQMTYLGYPNTSGMPLMDYRIGDVVADLDCNDAQNTETMRKMLIPMWNYTPWSDMPMLTASPLLENGYVTFGSANNHAKLQTPWLEVWAKALKALPDTQFLITSSALRSPKVARDFLDFFKHRGVPSERIEIVHYSPSKHEHWKTLSRFDIALDSFPYNGTTTTCDLLWMGVPTITRQGNSHVSRTTASLLSGMGMQSWIADNAQHFIELCEEKSNDHELLTCSRQTLRPRMQQSSIGDITQFIGEYERLLEETWAIHQ